MTKISPSITIIIPTRARKKTLSYTIKTCLMQDYQNLTVIVCDNFSNDGTQELLAGIKDSRLKCINPGKRLSMSENWEFAINRVNSDFVTIIGDDDGFLPSAISDLARIISRYDAKIVSWKKAEYTWPDYPVESMKSRLILPLTNKIFKVRSETAFSLIASFKMGYNLGPCIYNSIVSTSLIREVQKRGGSFFRSMCPDVFSSLNFVEATDYYLLSSRPFSVNGASGSSNGTSSVGATSNSKPYEMFIQEYFGDNLSHAHFGLIKGSLTAAIAESLIAFSANKPEVYKKLNFKKIFSRILHEIKGNNNIFPANIRIISELAGKHGQQKLLNRFLAAAKGDGRTVMESGKQFCKEATDLSIAAEDFGIFDVYSASIQSGRLLGQYQIPETIIDFSYWRYVVNKILQRLQRTSLNMGL